MQSTETDEFEKKIKKVPCYICGTIFTVETILISVFWNNHYYCQECGTPIIEEWKINQIPPIS